MNVITHLRAKVYLCISSVSNRQSPKCANCTYPSIPLPTSLSLMEVEMFLFRKQLRPTDRSERFWNTKTKVHQNNSVDCVWFYRTIRGSSTSSSWWCDGTMNAYNYVTWILPQVASLKLNLNNLLFYLLSNYYFVANGRGSVLDELPVDESNYIWTYLCCCTI